MDIESRRRTIRTFRDLRVWQEAVELVKEIYAVCGRLPRDEQYALANQPKRAAISIPSNIAEGHARNHRSEYRQSVYVAVGSLAELDTQVQLAVELGFLTREYIAPIIGRIDRLKAMLVTLAKKLS